MPLTARILQTVDIYDALTTDRPYRQALSHQQALATIREEVRRGWWDGALVDAFEVMLDHAPVLLAAPVKAGPTPAPGNWSSPRRQADTHPLPSPVCGRFRVVVHPSNVCKI